MNDATKAKHLKRIADAQLAFTNAISEFAKAIDAAPDSFTAYQQTAVDELLDTVLDMDGELDGAFEDACPTR